jgi:hypothetical protein
MFLRFNFITFVKRNELANVLIIYTAKMQSCILRMSLGSSDVIGLNWKLAICYGHNKVLDTNSLRNISFNYFQKKILDCLLLFKMSISHRGRKACNVK